MTTLFLVIVLIVSVLAVIGSVVYENRRWKQTAKSAEVPVKKSGIAQGSIDLFHRAEARARACAQASMRRGRASKARRVPAAIVAFDESGHPCKAQFVSRKGAPLIADIVARNGHDLLLSRGTGPVFRRKLALVA